MLGRENTTFVKFVSESPLFIFYNVSFVGRPSSFKTKYVCVSSVLPKRSLLQGGLHRGGYVEI
jgi:hypothetical protein